MVEPVHEIEVLHGVPDRLRAEAGALVFDAFSAKLVRLLGRDHRAPQLIARVIHPDQAICACARDGGPLVGLVGFQNGGTEFLAGTLADLVPFYGLIGGIWRGLGLRLLDQHPEPDCLHIDVIAVSPEARGRGIGHILLDACRDEALRRGLSGLSLDVVNTNPRAHALYQRYGFRDVRTRSIRPFQALFGFSEARRMQFRLEPQDKGPAVSSGA